MSKISVPQFVQKYDGKSIDFDKAYGAQCVDLFNYYNQEVVGAPRVGTPVTGGARDLFEVNNTGRDAYYEKLAANSDLTIGDVIVYGPPLGRAIENGKQVFYGHVNIYIGNNNVIEQNGKVAFKTVVREVYRGGAIGILRPRNFTNNSSPQNVPQQPQNKNKHTISSGDTFWGLEESYNIPHGTLQKLNPQLNPKSLTIGSEIIIRAEPVTAPSANETYYHIRAGDTFWGLENAWQLAHGTLQRLNPGVEPRTLQIGQRIRRS